MRHPHIHNHRGSRRQRNFLRPYLSPEVTFGYDNSKIILNHVNFVVVLTPVSPSWDQMARDRSTTTTDYACSYLLLTLLACLPTLPHEADTIQRLLCTAPRRYAHSDDELRPVPRAQVPRKDRAGILSAFVQLPN